MIDIRYDVSEISAYSVSKDQSLQISKTIPVISSGKMESSTSRSSVWSSRPILVVLEVEEGFVVKFVRRAANALLWKHSKGGISQNTSKSFFNGRKNFQNIAT